MRKVNVAYNEDCIIGMNRIANESVDVILTDPPYMYLKNRKLDRNFDEDAFFVQVNRILKSTGFLVLFGRGESFYRWNYKLSSLGLKFKEEIIWDKRYPSSPLQAISRMHETVAIWTKGCGVLNRVKVDYTEARKYNLDAIIADVKRLRSSLTSVSQLDEIIKFLDTGVKNTLTKDISDSTVTISSKTLGKAPRLVSLVDALQNGMNERSIISEVPEKYRSIHPTQKPVRLIERLLNLVAKPGDIIVDPFAGSFSTAKACINLGLNYIVFEIDNEYFDLGLNSLESYRENSKSNGTQGILFG